MKFPPRDSFSKHGFAAEGGLTWRSVTCSPFAVQDVLDAGLSDDGVVTLEPLVLVLADEGGVMAAL